MKKLKLIRNVLTLFAELATVVFISCDAFFGNEQNVTINLPPISSSARAISSDKISDLKSATTSYRITVNGMTREGAGGAFTFTLPVGMVAEITVECVNSSGQVIARAKKTHTVKSGTNNISINLSRDGVIVELTSTPQVGSIIMKDGTLCDTTSVVGREADAIAVVYKVSGGKAWAVGKELGSSIKWADSSAIGYTNIAALQEENGYTDGSTGLAKLIAAAPDAETDLATNYPAWDYACNYGTNQDLTNFQTGWYLPSKQELQEVYDQRNNIPSSLLNFGNSVYWSSSQCASNDFAYRLYFEIGSWSNNANKNNTFSVCAVRAFTY